MLRARAPVGQDLGGRWLLDGDEALPLQALEHRKRRRQWFTALAAMPAPVCDRHLDEGGQELGRRLFVIRCLHCGVQKAAGDHASRSRSRGRAQLTAVSAASTLSSQTRRSMRALRTAGSSAMPRAYAAGGGTSGISGVCLGCQRRPGVISANGAPAPAQPIAFASSRPSAACLCS